LSYYCTLLENETCLRNDYNQFRYSSINAWLSYTDQSLIYYLVWIVYLESDVSLVTKILLKSIQCASWYSLSVSLKFITKSDSETEPALKISSHESILNISMPFVLRKCAKMKIQKENSKIIARYKYLL